MDADDVLSLFSFLVSKAGIFNLYTHCRIIERFLTDNIMNSVNGYYLVTMQASLQHLEEIRKKNLIIEDCIVFICIYCGFLK